MPFANVGFVRTEKNPDWFVGARVEYTFTPQDTILYFENCADKAA
jgi:hypothetical protein